MLNRVVIVGRITRDPELKSTTSGKNVTSITVAVDNQYMKNPDGTRSTSFIPVTVWNASADFICKYGRKGSLVGVDGRLQQRTYKRNDGTNASVIEVIADSIQLLESKSQSGNQTHDNNMFNDGTANNAMSFNDGNADDVVKDLRSEDLADDDLPF